MPAKYELEVCEPMFKVRWARASEPRATCLAIHPHIEIQLIRRGHGHYLIGGHRHAFRRNAMLVVPPNTPHRFEPAPSIPCEKWMLMFRASMLRHGGRAFRLPPNLPYFMELDEAAAAEVEMVLRLLLTEHDRQRPYCTDCIAAALSYLIALIRRAARGGRPAPRRSPIVNWAIEHIEKEFRREFALPALAAQAGYSTYYLAHLFKRVTGMSIKQYVLQRRVAEAQRLLTEEPSLTVASVAGQSGFGSYRVFCRCFRKFSGANPAAYRNLALDAKAVNSEQ